MEYRLTERELKSLLSESIENFVDFLEQHNKQRYEAKEMAIKEAIEGLHAFVPESDSVKQGTIEESIRSLINDMKNSLPSPENHKIEHILKILLELSIKVSFLESKSNTD
jgi:hypothetical protein